MPHVLLAIEWLAKLHGLTYVSKKRFETNSNEDWLGQGLFPKLLTLSIKSNFEILTTFFTVFRS